MDQGLTIVFWPNFHLSADRREKSSGRHVASTESPNCCQFSKPQLPLQSITIQILHDTAQSGTEPGSAVCKAVILPLAHSSRLSTNITLETFLTLHRSQLIWEPHTTLHSVPCHPYTVLNPHISSRFLTHSALSNPIFSYIPAINSSSYSPCGLRSSLRPNSSHFWRCEFYIFVLWVRLK